MRSLITLLTLFTASQLSLTAERANYPEFSWDTIPLYMHIRKSEAFTDKEIDFISKFPLITLEKATGNKTYGSVEKGTLIAARAIKKANPKTKILYYRNVIVHYSGYADNKLLEKIPNSLLSDPKGNTKLVRNKVPAYDLSSTDVRKWWIKNCHRIVSDPSIDGVFLDGNIKALEPSYLKRTIGADKKKAVTAGFHKLIADTRTAIGDDKLMLSNIIRARLPNAGLDQMEKLDGSYIEGFFHPAGKNVSYEDYVAKGIDAIQQAARSGKIIAFTTSLHHNKTASSDGIDETHGKVSSDEQAQKNLLYPLALFLICAEKYSYLRVHEGYEADSEGRWQRWFAEYDKPLGPPSGPAARDGYQYTRKFKHATVYLDIKKRTGQIHWHKP